MEDNSNDSTNKNDGTLSDKMEPTNQESSSKANGAAVSSVKTNDLSKFSLIVKLVHLKLSTMFERENVGLLDIKCGTN